MSRVALIRGGDIAAASRAQPASHALRAGAPRRTRGAELERTDGAPSATRAGSSWSLSKTSVWPLTQVKRRRDGSGSDGAKRAVRNASLTSATTSTRATPRDAGRDAPPIVREVLRSSSKPLDAEARAFFEPRFGHDFGDVRVHDDAKAAELARAVDALAYTVGRDVVIGRGAREALGERRLMAHELSHVVQQTATNATSSAGIKVVDDPRAEREAERFGDAAAEGAKVGPVGFGSPKLGLQRQRASDEPEVKVVGHGASEDAVTVAGERMLEVLGTLGAPKETALKGASIELHIIPTGQKLTDLPEFASLKGQKTFDGRNYDDLRGVGGTKIGNTVRYAVAEEQLVSIQGKPSGYSTGFVAAHELGHIVQQFGLTADQQQDLQKAFDTRTKAGGPWLNPSGYTSSNVGEYFAQCVSAYFNRPYSDSEDDKKMYTKEWLRKNDPQIYKLLNEVYSSPRHIGDFPGTSSRSGTKNG